jgi:dUTP pyrophosphatase
MIKVKFKKLYDNVQIPVKGSEHSACYDVYVNNITIIPGKVVYGLGFATEIPLGYKGVVVPRSSATNNRWVLINSPGKIDADYRGEWKVVFTQLTINTKEKIPYEIGERCAQIYFEEELPIEFVFTDELSDTVRGEGGYGSTGLL